MIMRRGKAAIYSGGGDKAGESPSNSAIQQFLLAAPAASSKRWYDLPIVQA